MTKDLSFEVVEFRERVRSVQMRMDAEGMDALLVHTPENIYYLSGHQTPGYYAYQCLVVPAAGEPTLLTRMGEHANARAYSWLSSIATYDDGDDPADATLRCLSEYDLKSGAVVGCELKSWFLTPEVYLALRERAKAVSLAPGDGLVESLRVIKSPAEIGYIRGAAAVAEAGMAAAIAAVEEGRTDNDLAAAIHHAMMSAGGEYPSMGPFVAVGPRSGIMHGIWGRRIIRRGDAVTFEIGGVFQRYNGALMRTVSVGRPDAELVARAATAEAANSAVIERIRPGAMTADIHAAAARTLEDHGFGGARKGRRCGYSMGIAFAPDWGEGHLASINDTPNVELRPGMVFHLPMSLRDFDKKVGAGFSETVLVTEHGKEVLTAFERRLFVVD